MRRRALVVCCVAACGPAVDVNEAPTTVSPESSESTAGIGTSSSTTPVDTAISSADESTTDGSTSTGGPAPVDPCLAQTPPDCGPGCTSIVAYPENERFCGGVGDPNDQRELCITIGEPFAEVYRSTYYAEIDGERLFALIGQACVEQLSGVPTYWNECSGADGEPETCSCLCAQNVCGWEAEETLLDGCAYPTPCPPTEEYVYGGEYSEAQICVLTALRDRSPAVLVTTADGRESRVYVDSDAQAQSLQYNFPGICAGPLADAWNPNQRCRLAPPEYFDECLQAPPAEQYICMSSYNWLVECEETPAACP